MTALKTDAYLVVEAQRMSWAIGDDGLGRIREVKVVRALRKRPARLERDQIAVRVQLTVEPGAFSPIVADLALHVDADAVARAVVEQLAATLAKHPLYADDDGDVCKCGWEPNYAQIDLSVDAPTTGQEQVTSQHAAHVAAVIAGADDLAVIAKPDAKNPTPALIEAAYIAQDDLSKPPEPWLIESTAEIIEAYVDAQGHEKVHVFGHDAAVRAAAEAVSDR